MKITGAGPKIAVPSFLYLFLMIYLDYRTSPQFKITGAHYTVLVVISILLILLGAAALITCARKLLKSYKEGVLMTDGPYIICRNPMYASWTFFIIPGICLLFNSWLVLSTVVINFILSKIFIRDEYKYLEEKFGDQYREYLSHVWIKFI